MQGLGTQYGATEQLRSIRRALGLRHIAFQGSLFYGLLLSDSMLFELSLYDHFVK